MMLLAVLYTHVVQQKGSFNAQCKLTSGRNGEEGKYLIVTLEKVNKKEGESPYIVVDFSEFKDDNAKLKKAADILIGKSFMDFKLNLESYPNSLRFEGAETGSLYYKAKCKFSVGGVTQTLWGGMNTQYIASKPNDLYLKTLTGLEAGMIGYEWDIKEENFKFGPQRGIASQTTAYQKSEVFQFWTNRTKYSNPSTTNFWSQGITPQSTRNYWPKTRTEGGKLVVGGPKHGELVVAVIGLVNQDTFPPTMPEAWPVSYKLARVASSWMGNCVDAQEKDGIKTPKVTIPQFMYDNELVTLYNAENYDMACQANVFTTYDIYWNTWSVALTGSLMVLSTLVIIPTKCFNLKKLIQNKRATVQMGEVANAVAE